MDTHLDVSVRRSTTEADRNVRDRRPASTHAARPPHTLRSLASTQSSRGQAGVPARHWHVPQQRHDAAATTSFIYSSDATTAACAQPSMAAPSQTTDSGNVAQPPPPTTPSTKEAAATATAVVVAAVSASTSTHRSVQLRSQAVP